MIKEKRKLTVDDLRDAMISYKVDKIHYKNGNNLKKDLYPIRKIIKDKLNDNKLYNKINNK